MKNARSSNGTEALPVEITPFHRMCASAITVPCAVACLALVIVRHVTWDFPLDRWIVYTPSVLASFVLVWFGFFIVSTVKVVWRFIKRQREAIILNGLNGFPYSIRISLMGLAYTSVLLLFLLDLRFAFLDHIVRLIALVKLAAVHVLIVFTHGDDLILVFFHLALAGVYCSLGAILYSIPHDRLFMAIDLLAANAIMVFSMLFFINEQHITSFSVLLISGSFWNAAFSDIRTLSSVLFAVGIGLGGFSAASMIIEKIAQMIALMFGSWTKLIYNRDEHDPLIDN